MEKTDMPDSPPPDTSPSGTRGKCKPRAKQKSPRVRRRVKEDAGKTSGRASKESESVSTKPVTATNTDKDVGVPATRIDTAVQTSGPEFGSLYNRVQLYHGNLLQLPSSGSAEGKIRTSLGPTPAFGIQWVVSDTDNKVPLFPSFYFPFHGPQCNIIQEMHKREQGTSDGVTKKLHAGTGSSSQQENFCLTLQKPPLTSPSSSSNSRNEALGVVNHCLEYMLDSVFNLVDPSTGSDTKHNDFQLEDKNKMIETKNADLRVPQNGRPYQTILHETDASKCDSSCTLCRVPTSDHTPCKSVFTSSIPSDFNKMCDVLRCNKPCNGIIPSYAHSDAYPPFLKFLTSATHDNGIVNNLYKKLVEETGEPTSNGTPRELLTEQPENDASSGLTNISQPLPSISQPLPDISQPLPSISQPLPNISLEDEIRAKCIILQKLSPVKHCKQKFKITKSSLSIPCSLPLEKVSVALNLLSEKLPALTGQKFRELTNSFNKFVFRIEPGHHLKLPDGQKLYACDICSGVYQRSFSLKRHYLRSHVNYRHLSERDISNCGIVVGDKMAIPTEENSMCNSKVTPDGGVTPEESNIDSTTSNPQNEVSCPLKEGESTRTSSEKISSQEIRFPGLYRCHSCGTCYDVKEELKVHLTNHPVSTVSVGAPAAPQHVCKQCNMKFSDKYSFLRHSSVHQSEDKYAIKIHYCLFCNKGFKNAAIRKRHQSRVHDPLQKHATKKNFHYCPFCKKAEKFKELPTLMTHLMCEHVDEYFACLLCKLRFDSKENLQWHKEKKHSNLPPETHPEQSESMLNVAEKVIETDGLSTAKENSCISNSQISVSPATNEFSYSCPVCQKMFTNPVNMSRHKRLAHVRATSKPKKLKNPLGAAETGVSVTQADENKISAFASSEVFQKSQDSKEGFNDDVLSDSISEIQERKNIPVSLLGTIPLLSENKSLEIDQVVKTAKPRKRNIKVKRLPAKPRLKSIKLKQNFDNSENMVIKVARTKAKKSLSHGVATVPYSDNQTMDMPQLIDINNHNAETQKPDCAVAGTALPQYLINQASGDGKGVSGPILNVGNRKVQKPRCRNVKGNELHKKSRKSQKPKKEKGDNPSVESKSAVNDVYFNNQENVFTEQNPESQIKELQKFVESTFDNEDPKSDNILSMPHPNNVNAEIQFPKDLEETNVSVSYSVEKPKKIKYSAQRKGAPADSKKGKKAKFQNTLRRKRGATKFNAKSQKIQPQKIVEEKEEAKEDSQLLENVAETKILDGLTEPEKCVPAKSRSRKKRGKVKVTSKSTSKTQSVKVTQGGVLYKSTVKSQSTKYEINDLSYRLFQHPQSMSIKAEMDEESLFYSNIASNIRENLLNHLDGKLDASGNPCIKIAPVVERTIANDRPKRREKPTYKLDAAFNGFINDIKPPFVDHAGIKSETNQENPVRHRVSWEKYNFPKNYDGRGAGTTAFVKDMSYLDISTQMTMRQNLERLNSEIPSSHDVDELEEVKVEGFPRNLRLMEKCSSFPEKFAENGQLDLFRLGLCRSNSSASVSASHGDVPVKRRSLRRKSLSDLNSPADSRQGNSKSLLKDDSVNVAELSGEWVRPRRYICGACCASFTDLIELEDHKYFVHPNVWCTHFDFDEAIISEISPVSSHASFPTKSLKRSLLAKGTLHTADVVPPVSVPDLRCTKCEKCCSTIPELHRHMLDCGGDTTWMLTMVTLSPGGPRKNKKWRPFGSRKRKYHGRRGMKRNIPNSPIKMPNFRSKTRNADGDTIQRMIANLPPKRVRRAIQFKEEEMRTRSQATIHSNRLLRKRLKIPFVTISRPYRRYGIQKSQQLQPVVKGSSSEQDISILQNTALEEHHRASAKGKKCDKVIVKKIDFKSRRRRGFVRRVIRTSALALQEKQIQNLPGTDEKESISVPATTNGKVTRRRKPKRLESGVETEGVVLTEKQASAFKIVEECSEVNDTISKSQSAQSFKSRRRKSLAVIKKSGIIANGGKRGGRSKKGMSVNVREETVVCNSSEEVNIDTSCTTSSKSQTFKKVTIKSSKQSDVVEGVVKRGGKKKNILQTLQKKGSISNVMSSEKFSFLEENVSVVKVDHSEYISVDSAKSKPAAEVLSNLAMEKSVTSPKKKNASMGKRKKSLVSHDTSQLAAPVIAESPEQLSQDLVARDTLSALVNPSVNDLSVKKKTIKREITVQRKTASKKKIASAENVEGYTSHDKETVNVLDYIQVNTANETIVNYNSVESTTPQSCAEFVKKGKKRMSKKNAQVISEHPGETKSEEMIGADGKLLKINVARKKNATMKTPTMKKKRGTCKNAEKKNGEDGSFAQIITQTNEIGQDNSSATPGFKIEDMQSISKFEKTNGTITLKESKCLQFTNTLSLNRSVKSKELVRSTNSHNEPLICKGCGQEFKKNSGYSRHIKSCIYVKSLMSSEMQVNATESGDPHSCNRCGKSFKLCTSLLNHSCYCKRKNIPTLILKKNDTYFCETKTDFVVQNSTEKSRCEAESVENGKISSKVETKTTSFRIVSFFNGSDNNIQQLEKTESVLKSKEDKSSNAANDIVANIHGEFVKTDPSDENTEAEDMESIPLSELLQRINPGSNKIISTKWSRKNVKPTRRILNTKRQLLKGGGRRKKEKENLKGLNLKLIPQGSSFKAIGLETDFDDSKACNKNFRCKTVKSNKRSSATKEKNSSDTENEKHITSIESKLDYSPSQALLTHQDNFIVNEMKVTVNGCDNFMSQKNDQVNLNVTFEKIVDCADTVKHESENNKGRGSKKIANELIKDITFSDAPTKSACSAERNVEYFVEKSEMTASLNFKLQVTEAIKNGNCSLVDKDTSSSRKPPSLKESAVSVLSSMTMTSSISYIGPKSPTEGEIKPVVSGENITPANTPGKEMTRELSSEGSISKPTKTNKSRNAQNKISKSKEVSVEGTKRKYVRKPKKLPDNINFPQNITEAKSKFMDSVLSEPAKRKGGKKGARKQLAGKEILPEFVDIKVTYNDDTNKLMYDDSICLNNTKNNHLPVDPLHIENKNIVMKRSRRKGRSEPGNIRRDRRNKQKNSDRNDKTSADLTELCKKDVKENSSLLVAEKLPYADVESDSSDDLSLIEIQKNMQNKTKSLNSARKKDEFQTLYNKTADVLQNMAAFSSFQKAQDAKFTEQPLKSHDINVIENSNFCDMIYPFTAHVARRLSEQAKDAVIDARNNLSDFADMHLFDVVNKNHNMDSVCKTSYEVKNTLTLTLDSNVSSVNHILPQVDENIVVNGSANTKDTLSPSEHKGNLGTEDTQPVPDVSTTKKRRTPRKKKSHQNIRDEVESLKEISETVDGINDKNIELVSPENWIVPDNIIKNLNGGDSELRSFIEKNPNFVCNTNSVTITSSVTRDISFSSTKASTNLEEISKLEEMLQATSGLNIENEFGDDIPESRNTEITKSKGRRNVRGRGKSRGRGRRIAAGRECRVNSSETKRMSKKKKELDELLEAAAAASVSEDAASSFVSSSIDMADYLTGNRTLRRRQERFAPEPAMKIERASRSTRWNASYEELYTSSDVPSDSDFENEFDGIVEFTHRKVISRKRGSRSRIARNRGRRWRKSLRKVAVMKRHTDVPQGEEGYVSDYESGLLKNMFLIGAQNAPIEDSSFTETMDTVNDDTAHGTDFGESTCVKQSFDSCANEVKEGDSIQGDYNISENIPVITSNSDFEKSEFLTEDAHEPDNVFQADSNVPTITSNFESEKLDCSAHEVENNLSEDKEETSTHTMVPTISHDSVSSVKEQKKMPKRRIKRNSSPRNENTFTKSVICSLEKKTEPNKLTDSTTHLKGIDITSGVISPDHIKELSPSDMNDDRNNEQVLETNLCEAIFEENNEKADEDMKSSNPVSEENNSGTHKDEQKPQTDKGNSVGFSEMKSEIKKIQLLPNFCQLCNKYFITPYTLSKHYNSAYHLREERRQLSGAETGKKKKKNVKNLKNSAEVKENISELETGIYKLEHNTKSKGVLEGEDVSRGVLEVEEDSLIVQTLKEMTKLVESQVDGIIESPAVGISTLENSDVSTTVLDISPEVDSSSNMMIGECVEEQEGFDDDHPTLHLDIIKQSPLKVPQYKTGVIRSQIRKRRPSRNIQRQNNKIKCRSKWVEEFTRPARSYRQLNKVEESLRHMPLEECCVLQSSDSYNSKDIAEQVSLVINEPEEVDNSSFETVGNNTDYTLTADVVTDNEGYAIVCPDDNDEIIPCLQEQAEIIPCVKEHTEINPCLKEQAEIIRCLKEQAEIIPCVKEQAEIIPRLKEQDEIIQCAKEQAEIIPCLKEHTEIIPCLKERREIIPCLQEQSEIIPCVKEHTEINPCLKEQAEIIPCVKEQAEIIPCLKEQDEIIQCAKEQAEIIPCLKEHTEIIPCLKERREIIPCLQEQGEIIPCLKEQGEKIPCLKEQAAHKSDYLYTESNLDIALESFLCNTFDSDKRGQCKGKNTKAKKNDSQVKKKHSKTKKKKNSKVRNYLTHSSDNFDVREFQNTCQENKINEYSSEKCHNNDERLTVIKIIESPEEQRNVSNYPCIEMEEQTKETIIYEDQTKGDHNKNYFQNKTEYSDDERPNFIQGESKLPKLTEKPKGDVNVSSSFQDKRENKLFNILELNYGEKQNYRNLIANSHDRNDYRTNSDSLKMFLDLGLEMSKRYSKYTEETESDLCEIKELLVGDDSGSYKECIDESDASLRRKNITTDKTQGDEQSEIFDDIEVPEEAEEDIWNLKSTKSLHLLNKEDKSLDLINVINMSEYVVKDDKPKDKMSIRSLESENKTNLISALIKASKLNNSNKAISEYEIDSKYSSTGTPEKQKHQDNLEIEKTVRHTNQAKHGKRFKNMTNIEKSGILEHTSQLDYEDTSKYPETERSAENLVSEKTSNNINKPVSQIVLKPTDSELSEKSTHVGEKLQRELVTHFPEVSEVEKKFTCLEELDRNELHLFELSRETSRVSQDVQIDRDDSKSMHREKRSKSIVDLFHDTKAKDREHPEKKLKHCKQLQLEDDIKHADYVLKLNHKVRHNGKINKNEIRATDEVKCVDEIYRRKSKHRDSIKNAEKHQMLDIFKPLCEPEIVNENIVYVLTLEQGAGKKSEKKKLTMNAGKKDMSEKQDHESVQESSETEKISDMRDNSVTCNVEIENNVPEDKIGKDNNLDNCNELKRLAQSNESIQTNVISMTDGGNKMLKKEKESDVSKDQAHCNTSAEATFQHVGKAELEIKKCESIVSDVNRSALETSSLGNGRDTVNEIMVGDVAIVATNDAKLEEKSNNESLESEKIPVLDTGMESITPLNTAIDLSTSSVGQLQPADEIKKNGKLLPISNEETAGSKEFIGSNSISSSDQLNSLQPPAEWGTNGHAYSAQEQVAWAPQPVNMNQGSQWAYGNDWPPQPVWDSYAREVTAEVPSWSQATPEMHYFNPSDPVQPCGSLGSILDSVNQVLDDGKNFTAESSPATTMDGYYDYSDLTAEHQQVFSTFMQPAGFKELQQAMGATDEEMAMLQQLGESYWPVENAELLDLDNQKKEEAKEVPAETPNTTEMTKNRLKKQASLLLAPCRMRRNVEEEKTKPSILSQYESKEMVCPLCNKRFLGLTALQVHTSVDHEECEKRMKNTNEQARKALISSFSETILPQHQHMCTVCKELHSDNDSLVSHMKTKHGSDCPSAEGPKRGEGLKSHISSTLVDLLNRAKVSMAQLASKNLQQRRQQPKPNDDLFSKVAESDESCGSSQLDKDLTYTCHVCNEKFYSLSAKHSHFMNVHPRHTETCSSPSLSHNFDSEDYFSDDREELDMDSSCAVDPDDESSFLCSDCGINFKTPREVIEHRALEHPSLAAASQESSTSEQEQQSQDSYKVGRNNSSECTRENSGLLKGKSGESASQKLVTNSVNIDKMTTVIKAKAEAAIRELTLSRKVKSGTGHKWGIQRYRFTVPDREPGSESSEAKLAHRSDDRYNLPLIRKACSSRFASLTEKKNKTNANTKNDNTARIKKSDDTFKNPDVYDFLEDDNSMPVLEMNLRTNVLTLSTDDGDECDSSTKEDNTLPALQTPDGVYVDPETCKTSVRKHVDGFKMSDQADLKSDARNSFDAKTYNSALDSLKETFLSADLLRMKEIRNTVVHPSPESNTGTGKLKQSCFDPKMMMKINEKLKSASTIFKELSEKKLQSSSPAVAHIESEIPVTRSEVSSNTANAASKHLKKKRKVSESDTETNQNILCNETVNSNQAISNTSLSPSVKRPAVKRKRGRRIATRVQKKEVALSSSSVTKEFIKKNKMKEQNKKPSGTRRQSLEKIEVQPDNISITESVKKSSRRHVKKVSYEEIPESELRAVEDAEDEASIDSINSVPHLKWSENLKKKIQETMDQAQIDSSLSSSDVAISTGKGSTKQQKRKRKPQVIECSIVNKTAKPSNKLSIFKDRILKTKDSKASVPSSGNDTVTDDDDDDEEDDESEDNSNLSAKKYKKCPTTQENKKTVLLKSIFAKSRHSTTIVSGPGHVSQDSDGHVTVNDSSFKNGSTFKERPWQQVNF